LHKNYPNPFNPQTTIEYQLPHTAEVELIIFDLQGNEVRRLVNGTKSAGYHTVMWDARDGTGRLVTSGVYFYRIDIQPKDIGQGSFMDVKKMILLK
jgi:flagellar hook assembly protein FlgD